MKLAVISDTHDNVPNLEKALGWMKKNSVAELIHCGDLCAPSILVNILAPNFNGPIHMVFGNIEDRELTQKKAKDFPQVKHYGDLAEMEIGGKKIAAVHYPEKAGELAGTGKYDLVFYGHNHKPWEEAIGRTRLVNPGTLAGLFQRATFAAYDTSTDNLELIILDQL